MVFNQSRRAIFGNMYLKEIILSTYRALRTNLLWDFYKITNFYFSMDETVIFTGTFFQPEVHVLPSLMNIFARVIGHLMFHCCIEPIRMK